MHVGFGGETKLAYRIPGRKKRPWLERGWFYGTVTETQLGGPPATSSSSSQHPARAKGWPTPCKGCVSAVHLGRARLHFLGPRMMQRSPPSPWGGRVGIGRMSVLRAPVTNPVGTGSWKGASSQSAHHRRPHHQGACETPVVCGMRLGLQQENNLLGNIAKTLYVTQRHSQNGR
jgi:hypothetical protein